MHHWALDCLTRSSFDQTPAHTLGWVQASDKGGNLQLDFKVNFLYCGVGLQIKYLLQASDSDLIIFSNKCCLGLTGNRKSKLITGICSLAYSYHNYCSAAITAVPAPQVQHQKGAQERVGKGLSWLLGRSPLVSDLGAKGNTQELRIVPLPGNSPGRESYFQCPIGLRERSPVFTITHTAIPGTNMCLFSWCQRKQV